MTQPLVKPGDWPGPVVEALTVMWDAMYAADTAIGQAKREKGTDCQALTRLGEEFSAARYELTGFLLETLPPDPDDDDLPDTGDVAAPPDDTPAPQPA